MPWWFFRRRSRGSASASLCCNHTLLGSPAPGRGDSTSPTRPPPHKQHFRQSPPAGTISPLSGRDPVQEVTWLCVPGGWLNFIPFRTRASDFDSADLAIWFYP